MEVTISKDKADKRMFLDLLKGLAIFLVFWGHCIQYGMTDSGLDFFENPFFKLIYSFHMPLFMLISGYLFHSSFEKREMWQLIRHRSRPMVCSIVFCGFLNGCLTHGVYGVLRGDIGILTYDKWIGSLTDLWFLWAVLFSSVAVALICKRIKRVWLQIICLTFVMALAVLLPNRSVIIYMHPYFVIGYYFAKYKSVIPARLMKVKYASLVLFPVLFLFYEKKHYIYTTGIFGTGRSLNALTEAVRVDVFRWVIGLVGSVFVVVLMELLAAGVSREHLGVVGRAVEKMGQKSLQLYCLSVSLLSFWLPKVLHVLFLKMGTGNVLVENLPVFNVLITPAMAVFYCAAVYAVVRLLEGLRVSRLLFGR